MRTSASLIALLFAALVAMIAPHDAQAIEAPAGAKRTLYLDVLINDRRIDKIGTFFELADGRMVVAAGELRELGFKVGPQVLDVPPDANYISLDRLPGVTFRYDEPAQTISFMAADRNRLPNVYDAQAPVPSVAPERSTVGGLLNYTLGASATPAFGSFHTSPAAVASLDGRLFGPLGTLSQTVIASGTPVADNHVLRLDTTWHYSDPDTLLSYRAGDIISSGFAWTRPIRLGGVQVQRSFALKPDLLTLPLPTVSGSAAVPSTVDVYINSVRAHTQQVQAGPYEISNVPVATGSGEARIVVRDAAGRETVTTLPFYATPKLLRPGLVDFSIEAGAPRLRYGIDSASYAEEIAMAASLRRGITDALTLESHAEIGAGLVEGGVGATIGLGSAGVLSLAGSASHASDAFGWRTYVSYDVKIGTASWHASVEKASKEFADLASVTSRYAVAPPAVSGSLAQVQGFLSAAKPPTLLASLSAGLPLGDGPTSLYAGLFHLQTADGQSSNLVNATLSRSFLGSASLTLSAYADVGDHGVRGGFIGVTIPLGKSASASTGITSTGSAARYTAEAAQALQRDPGSFGWRVREEEGIGATRSGELAYRSSAAEYRGGVQETAGVTSGYVQVKGAVASTGRGVFFSNTIDDAFAVVDAGSPGVPVLYENREIGRTGPDGRLLVPNLRSNEANALAIDPLYLPLDADATVATRTARPLDRGGVLVDFGVRSDTASAIVVLVDKNAQFLSAGTRGVLEPGTVEFVVGYDGRAFVKGLAAQNDVRLSGPTGDCRAHFAFSGARGQQTVIGPITCE